MTNRPAPGGFQSVDWDNLTEKRDWSGLGWTTAAVLVILLGFFGGMIFRTSLTGGPDDARELAPSTLTPHIVQTAEQATEPASGS